MIDGASNESNFSLGSVYPPAARNRLSVLHYLQQKARAASAQMQAMGATLRFSVGGSTASASESEALLGKIRTLHDTAQNMRLLLERINQKTSFQQNIVSGSLEAKAPYVAGETLEADNKLQNLDYLVKDLKSVLKNFENGDGFPKSTSSSLLETGLPPPATFVRESASFLP